MIERIKGLFNLDEDAVSEQEIIGNITRGVNFRGAKLWILVIAVFVASLGLNTNSAAVIIGAMLISPLMGPIIGMGLSIGIYDFDLLRRSWRNYIVATAFSVLTATIYFLITPYAAVQSELLARTSPTIYDVLIALCGGLAGIIALGSHSQRTGNVIPGVAIATALMPPLCTVGFGLATAHWTYALGALYLFIINSIFIAGATFVGAVFIMKFTKKTYIDKEKEKRVRRIMLAVALIAIIPSVWLTIGLVRENNFEQRVNTFIQQELHFPSTQVVTHRADFDSRSFKVVIVGSELDSATVENVRQRLPYYKLSDVTMDLIQGSSQVQGLEELEAVLQTNSQTLSQDQTLIAQQQSALTSMESQLQVYTNMNTLASMLLNEAKVWNPQVEGVSLARGASADSTGVNVRIIAVVTLGERLRQEESQRLVSWLQTRIHEDERYREDSVYVVTDAPAALSETKANANHKRMGRE